MIPLHRAIVLCVFPLISAGLVSCSSRSYNSPRALHEAQQVVAVADSLRAIGQLYPDSTRLAQAYETLNHWQLFYPDEFAHSCYHYGRLLRDKDNPVAAMQVFINATHSRTRDYHILGRVYSNMGSICQLEGNTDLAYDMYVISGEKFKKSGDLQAYYYSINNMALQRVQQKDKKTATSLLSQIEQNCSDSAVLSKVIETKALACHFVGEHDSAIQYVNLLQYKGNHDQYGYIIKAQSFWYLNKYDSALYYAQYVLSQPCSKEAQVSMLYITSHNDPTLSSDSILSITSERADKQFEITHMQGELSHAVELLQQDLIPNYKWLYGVIITLIIIAIIISIVLLATKKHRAVIRLKLQQTKKHIEDIHKNKMNELERSCKALRCTHNIKEELCWNDYKRMCAIVNNQLFFLATKLQQMGILSEKEIRLCILVVIDFSYKEMSDILPYSISGLGKFKYSTAKKIDTDTKNMRKKLIKLAVGE